MQLEVPDNNRLLLLASTPFPFLKSFDKRFLEQVVVDRIQSDDGFLETALVAIYWKQTPEERRRG